MAAIDGIHHVYNMVPGRADMYITTTNEITRKFGVDYGPDVARSLKAEKWVNDIDAPGQRQRGCVVS